MNIGLVGVGRWGKNIAKTLLRFEEIELCCVTSSNPNIHNFIPDGCRVYKEWQNMLTHPNLDGIIVSTPPDTHYEIAKSSLIKEIPVLVEKPLTLNEKEALSLKKISMKNNTLLMTEFTQVFNPKFKALKNSLNLIGIIKKIYTEAYNFGPIRKDTPVLWDWGSHELSILISLLNQTPKFIKATKINQKINNIGDASTWEIICNFKNQITSVSKISNIYKKKRKISVIGSKGIITLDDVSVYPLKFYKGQHLNSLENEKENLIYIENQKKPLDEALLNFFKCIRNQEINHWSLDLGVEVTQLLEQCSKDF